MERITVLWEGKWQDAEVLGPFRPREIVARLIDSGEEIVVQRPIGGSTEERMRSIERASQVFHIEMLLADMDNILEVPLTLN